MGMGLPVLPIYFTVAILVAPALIEMGLLPLAVHLFIIWYAMTSGITPPVCPMAYLTAAIARGRPMRTGFISARLAIVAFSVPLLFIFNPELILRGTLAAVAVVVLTATIGVIGLSIGLAGYLLTNLTWWGI